MASATGPELRPAAVGARVRVFRQQLGMSRPAVAGLAGLSESHLSMLEGGQRRFDRWSLIDRVAEALGCSVLDLTGEPYVPADRASAEALTAIPELLVALFCGTLDDVPDAPARPIERLAELVHAANAARDQSRYDLAGRELGPLLTELQIVAATQNGQTRQDALRLLIEACLVARALAQSLGHPDLAAAAARRGYDAARRLGDAAMLGFATWCRALALRRLGARRRVSTVLAEAIEAAEPHADPSAPNPQAAEAYGFLHLMASLHAAGFGNGDQARDHIAEASRIAKRTGERDTLRMHFGPTNVAVWRVAIGVELEEGVAAYERAMAAGIDPGSLDSPNRVGAFHLELARALAQQGGARTGTRPGTWTRQSRPHPHASGMTRSRVSCWPGWTTAPASGAGNSSPCVTGSGSTDPVFTPSGGHVVEGTQRLGLPLPPRWTTRTTQQ